MKKISVFISFFAIVFAFAQTPTISVTKVDFKLCSPTYTTINLDIDKGQEWNGRIYPKSGTYVELLQNARGCDSLITVNVNVWEGSLPGKFSIDANGTMVSFSKGNLQYCANPTTGSKIHKVAGGGYEQGIWRFASNQYITCGGTSNSSISITYSGWIDLFGWGTSGYNNKHPYMSSTSNSDYINSCDITGTNYDWGIYNAISNGGDEPGLWFSMTRDQWEYLYNGRLNAANLRGNASVCGVSGYLLLPDDWQLPEGCSFSSNVKSTNYYSALVWPIMEQAGAVFFPNANTRTGTQSPETANDSKGRIWSTTGSGMSAYHFRWPTPQIITYNVYAGYSVRLVHLVH